MNTVRLSVTCLLVIVVLAVGWKTACMGASHQAGQRLAVGPATAAPGKATTLASVQQPGGSPPSAPGPTAARVVEAKITEERLGPFSISGNSYSVVLHKKHLADTEGSETGSYDGVVAMEIVDATRATLYRRTYPLWADAEAVSAWTIFAHILSGTNGTGLLVKSSPSIDPADPDPESNASYEQIFGVVNGKFMPFSGPFPATLGKPDAHGVYPTAGALGGGADELQLGLGTGRFMIIVPIRVDWAQGKLTLAPQCLESAGNPHELCQYQLLDPNSFLKRPKDLTFVRLYPSPNGNLARPERVVVKPASQIDLLAYIAKMEMKQPDASHPPSPTEPPLDDMVQIAMAPDTDTWLQVRIDGKVGWIHSDEDLTAIGLPESDDPN